MSSLDRFNALPNDVVYQQLSGHILSYLDRDAQGAVACTGRGLTQHVTTFHLAEGVKELFDSVIRELRKKPSSERRSDPLMHIFSFLDSQSRNVVRTVSHRWNNGLDRLALEKKNAEIEKRFEPLRKTLGLLTEHFDVHPNITPKRKEFIAQALTGILPNRKDVKDVAEVKRLEHRAQGVVADLLRMLNQQELAAFLQFSNFNKDNDLARFLNFIIKYVPIYGEEVSARDDIEALRVTILLHFPYFPLNPLDSIALEIQNKAEKAAKEGNPTRAVQLATIYSEILPEEAPGKATHLMNMSLLLSEKGFAAAGIQIATLCAQTVSNSSGKVQAIEKIYDGLIEKGASSEQLYRVGKLYCKTVIEWATLLSETEEYNLADRLRKLSRSLIKRGFFAEGVQIATLCVETVPNSEWTYKVFAIGSIYDKLVKQGASREQRCQVAKLFCRPVIETNLLGWGSKNLLHIATVCSQMIFEDFPEREEALRSIGVALIKTFINSDGAYEIKSDEPLSPNIAYQGFVGEEQGYSAISQAFAEKGCFDQGVDIAVICYKMLSRSPEKARAIGEMGSALVRKGASEQVFQIAELCCKMATEDDLQDWLHALYCMICEADKQGNPALERDIALQASTLIPINTPDVPGSMENQILERCPTPRT